MMPTSTHATTVSLIPRGLLTWACLAALAAAQAGPAHAQVEAPPPVVQDAQGDPRAPGAPSDDAIRMGSPTRLPEGTTPERMWPAPSADDWRRPCLITWQRTFEDAFAVAKSNDKPILICVNMDGEIASEHYAGVRYRDPESARLYEPYVCVVASVYRHAPRDYGDDGTRVPCPRFGNVTCGEHVEAERQLYERYFDGKRIAPRHIMIELDRSEVYDVYFSWDTQTVFTALAQGVANRPRAAPLVRNDRPLVERLRSPDVVDRVAIETAYRQGTRDERRKIIESMIESGAIEQVDVLRHAIQGLDVELATLARRALARADGEAAVDLIAVALKVPMQRAERDALIEAAARLAGEHPRAHTLVALHRGVASASTRIEIDAWSDALARPPSESDADAHEASESQLARDAELVEARPDDGWARLELAKSTLARALDHRRDRRLSQALIAEARRLALQARERGADRWDAHAVLAVTSRESGDIDAAMAHAVECVEARIPADVVADASLRSSVAAVLELFAQARQRAIGTAYQERRAWPPEWLPDVHAAYSVLARHPDGTDQHAASHYDFMRWLGATAQARRALDEGLARFPESWSLHDRLRGELLWNGGPEALRSGYEVLSSRADAPAGLAWFAGYACLVSAEHHRRRGETEGALAAYDRAASLYEQHLLRAPDHRESSDHYIALAHAGRARIALERDDLERATGELLDAFRRSPSAAASPDGLGITPIDTARMLRERLLATGRSDLAASVETALGELDARLLEPPEHERGVTR